MAVISAFGLTRTRPTVKFVQEFLIVFSNVIGDKNSGMSETASIVNGADILCTLFTF